MSLLKCIISYTIFLFLLSSFSISISVDHKSDASKDTNNICALSTSISNTIQSGFYSYPLDYYLIGSTHKADLITYRCDAKPFSRNEVQQYGSENEMNHTCANICPLDSNRLGSFRGRENRAQYDALCPIYQTFENTSVVKNEDKQVINFIILGGSVAEGYRTENDCFSKDERSFKAVEKYGPLNTHYKSCSYAAQLWRWLVRESAGNAVVNFQRVTLGGWTSQVMSDMVLKQLSDVDITTLTQHDIVIIDHSVNDDAKLSGQPGFMKILEKSLEVLIRKILSISQGSGPAIILHNMASRLHYSGYQPSETNATAIETAVKPKDDSDIQTVYERVAHHYSIPIWSYRDVLWGSTTPDPLALTLRVGAYGDIHPPWHVHLFVADLFASSMMIEFSKCSRGNNVMRPETLAKTPVMPPPLVNDTGISAMLCDAHSDSGNHNQYYLDKDSDAAYKYYQNYTRHHRKMSESSRHRSYYHFSRFDVDLNVYEDRKLKAVASANVSKWVLRKERRNKIGWISELHSSDVTPTVAADTNNVLSVGSNPSEWVNLTFPLKPHKVGQKLWEHDIGIQIYILRTYLNAGVASVYLCDYKIGTMDALWQDHQSFKVSLPELQTFRLRKPIAENQHPCHPSQRNPLALTIVHEGATDNLESRTKLQKMKVMSVNVCKLKQDHSLGYDGVEGMNRRHLRQ